ncbi:hypothetical protein NW762_002586 [Fusarium torreyae]|uniref:BZIP domain-containing protein n=1 Tax=Fusarium torreyae TaxID=1237075 RepID=A0A9W8SCE2_9HYPO|nr:hypothetical protein NW762_002586 [Fusarium torreyae]
MGQERTQVSQRPANVSEPKSGSSGVKKKVVRRDPEKRRMQNRLAQQIYREKQRKRIQELERRAGQLGTEAQGTDDNLLNGVQPVGEITTEPVVVGSLPDAETINPSYLQTDPGTSTSHSPADGGTLWDQSLIFEDFDRWLMANPIYDVNTSPVIFFNCGCPTLHVPNYSKHVLLPVMPNPYKNALQIDVICVVSAMLENCLSLGISRSMYCSDDAISPFYRAYADTDPNRDAIVTSVQGGSRALHFDLRPTRQQVLVEHHPFLDVIPFREIRDNIITHMNDMDEDAFFHDSLNHLTCWGSVAGAHTGSPWDGRSWEATEGFLQKWSHIVGGEEGELARNSRWWRSLRGERTVTEVM